jgi:putative ABC transport system substrate-binding protein
MKRREFITLLGGVTAAWPLAAQAQRPAIPVIGYLNTGSPESDVVPLTAFHQGLGESAYVENQNVAIEYRWAESERLPAIAAELVRYPVSAIAAIGTPPTLAAKAATSTIPIVFYVGVDPVEFGFVSSFNRPNRNMTGVAALQGELAAKRIALLHELVPKASVIALLVNPTNRFTESETRAVHEGARALGLQLHILRASTASEIELAFRTFAQLRVGALLVNSDVFLLSQREQIVALAARHALPAVYGWREYAAAGGMMCYAPSLSYGYRLVGVYAGRILKGANPADLPVQQPTKFELVLNLRTAKALGLTVPDKLLVAADEVIE